MGKAGIHDAKMDGELGEVTFCAWYHDQSGLHPHLSARSLSVGKAKGFIPSVSFAFTRAAKSNRMTRVLVAVAKI